MKASLTFTFCLLSLAMAGQAQNQIITPVGKPLVIGNQGGVKFSHLNANSPTQASNGKVLSVNESGVVMLVPESAGGASQWTTIGTNPDLYFNSGNVGIGTSTPLQRLDVNGSINMPATSSLRFNNVPFLSSPGTDNLFLGPNVGAANTTGFSNLFIGSEAGMTNTSGYDNLFIGGSRSGLVNTTGDSNVFVGTATGASNSSGSKNAFVGRGSGFYNTTGSDNTFVGWAAGIFNTSGGNNVYVGRATGVGVAAGSSNTFLGSNASSSVNSTSYSTAVGEGSKVDCNYCLVLGRTSPQVKVGIGTSTPQTTLHVKADGTTVNGVRFENLPTTTGSGAFRLYVDASGNVLRRSTAGAREAAEESSSAYWTLTPDNHLLNANAEGVMIGTGLTAAPAGYKLYVSDGILTERVKVAVKSTADWRDNVLDSDYKLRPLEEVESFIKANKHLPGVPSARDMVENGNDLHQTDAVLLEKIEEMMLYIIDLKKENTVLKGEAAENRKVKAELVESRASIRSLLERVSALEKKGAF